MRLSILITHVDANTFWLLYKTSTTLLQMSDDNPYVIPEMDPTLRKQIQQCNWQVVNVTTPANYFHVLRRQVIFFCKFTPSSFETFYGAGALKYFPPVF